MHAAGKREEEIRRVAEAGAVSRMNLSAWIAKKRFRLARSTQNHRRLAACAAVDRSESHRCAPGTFAEAAGELLGSELTRFATLFEMDRIADELDTAPRASPISSKPSRNIPTWIRRPCRKWIFAKSLDTTLTIMHHKLKRSDHRNARLRARFAEGDGVRQRTQPGVDESDRQRRRRHEGRAAS